MKKNNCKRVIALVMLVFLCGICNAQSWTKMVQWFEESGYDFVPKMGHPMDKVLSHQITEKTEDKIVVSYVYRDCVPFFGIGDYTCKYEIRKGESNGRTFFRTIRVLVEGYTPAPSFTFWNDNTAAGYADIYSAGGYSALFGSSFQELSIFQRAAFVLTRHYYNYLSE